MRRFENRMKDAPSSPNRIVLFCGSLAQGMDGVGDYSRRLAIELERSNVETALVALAERGHQLEAVTTAHPTKCASHPLIQLPEIGNWESRLNEVRSSLGSWEPNVVSLQLSPFGLARRGLLHDLGAQLRKCWPNAAGHLMVHELWCGMDATTAPIKERLLGWLQRRGIRRFLREFQPCVVHTSNTFYRQKLAEQGGGAIVLPLAGAFPLAPAMEDRKFCQWLSDIGLAGVVADRSSWWLGCVFGSVYSVAILREIAERVREIGAGLGRKVAIVFIGNPKKPEEELLEALRGCDILLAIAGFQKAETVSQVMQQVEFGICTTPVDGVGKSSSTASFLDHGVPVLVHPSRLAPCAGSPLPELDPLLLLADKTLSDALRNGWPRGHAESRMGAVARQFLDDLREAKALSALKEVTTTSVLH